MITPRFDLSQDTSTLTIKVGAPYCNLKDLDVSVDKNEFIFACSPYYLRLNLPGNILENNSKSSFDKETGEFTFLYEKENNGEESKNLDLTTFMQPETIDAEECGIKIKVLTSNNCTNCAQEDSTAEYGFALRGGYNFKTVKSEFPSIFHIDPYQVKFNDRRGRRISKENKDFDVCYYLADITDDEEINEICDLKCPWKYISKTDIMLTNKELDLMEDLPYVNHNLSPQQINYCFNSLVEILFAYCYDRRTTYYEGTCESDWTISTISSSLSCFDSFTNPNEALICGCRRVLTYPLYRSFKLCEQVLEDLKLLIRLGIKYIIHCLIDIHDIFEHGNSGRYILNKLYIDDYIIFMLKCEPNSWAKIADTVCELNINKSELHLHICEIEKSFDNGELLCTALKNLNVDEDSDDTDTSSDSESSSSDSDSDETESCSSGNTVKPNEVPGTSSN